MFWRVLACSGGVLGRSGVFYGVFYGMLCVLACSGMFWRVWRGLVCSGCVLELYGLFYDMLRVLACSAVFCRGLVCSGGGSVWFWAVFGCVCSSDAGALVVWGVCWVLVLFCIMSFCT